MLDFYPIEYLISRQVWKICHSIPEFCSRTTITSVR